MHIVSTKLRQVDICYLGFVVGTEMREVTLTYKVSSIRLQTDTKEASATVSIFSGESVVGSRECSYIVTDSGVSLHEQAYRELSKQISGELVM